MYGTRATFGGVARDCGGQIVSEEGAEVIRDAGLRVLDCVPTIDSVVVQQVFCERLEGDLPWWRLAVQALANLFEPVSQHLL
jgi:hypothetical protein